jgi:hypothetical protein
VEFTGLEVDPVEALSISPLDVLPPPPLTALFFFEELFFFAGAGGAGGVGAGVVTVTGGGAGAGTVTVTGGGGGASTVTVSVSPARAAGAAVSMSAAAEQRDSRERRYIGTSKRGRSRFTGCPNQPAHATTATTVRAQSTGAVD